MREWTLKLAIPLALIAAGPASADAFKLSSSDISHGNFMTKSQEFAGFGCQGENISPQLSWSGAPNGTQAFALLAYDPDAPTGSGWWHWQLVNIPKEISSLSAGAGNPSNKTAPAGAVSTRNDFGAFGFGGVCPPAGHGAHRYQFTIFALSSKLEIPEGASGALTGYMVRANSLGSSTIEALYKKD